MERSYLSTSPNVGTSACHSAGPDRVTATTHTRPGAFQSVRVTQDSQQKTLSGAFGRFSPAFDSSENLGIPRGHLSVPASCSTSRTTSRSSSRSSDKQGPSFVSCQQSFTFTTPSWQDSSFVSWKPTQAAQRLEKTTSMPRLPQKSLMTKAEYGARGFKGTLGGSSTVVQQPEIVTRQCRHPCIVGWAEIESTKLTEFPTGKKVYRCTYCNVPLQRLKNYVTTWPKVLFCQACKGLPQCNSCCKKAVPFVYTDADGIVKIMQPVCDFGGLNLCGQCALINPVVDRPTVLDLVKKGRIFLQKLFGVDFTEQLLEPHTKPEVISCLEALRLAAYTQGPCSIKMDSEACAARPKTLRKNSSGDVAELPFDIGPVWHMQLSRNGNQRVYGRCETRALTFPPQNDEPGTQNKSLSPRTYRVVQRIMLSRGVPEGLIYGHLVHELLHAFIWLFLDSKSVKIDLAAEEGLCNCILAAALQMRVETLQERREAVLNALVRRGVHPKTIPGVKEVKGISEAAQFLKSAMEKTRPTQNFEACDNVRVTEEQSCSYLEYQLYVTEYELKVLNRRLSEMEKDSDPAYGVGYRTIRELAMKLTVIKLIEIFGKHGETLNSIVSASGAYV